MNFTVREMLDWKNPAEYISNNLQHKILLLRGNLGAGKTTFTQFLLKELGSQDEVNSPTYSIVNEYNTTDGKVFHFDLYRLKNIEEVFDIGMDEYLEEGILSIIEWPEIYEEELERVPHHNLKIENYSDFRELIFK